MKEIIIGIKVCFSSNVDRKTLISDIVSNDLFNFIPEVMDIDYSERVYDSKKALKLISKTKKNNGVIFKTQDESTELLVSFAGIITPPLSISLTTSNLEFQYENFIEQFIGKEDFIAAYVYDYADVRLQSQTSISYFERNGIDHTNLPKVKDEWDDLIIDTSKNYGREILLNDLWLLSSPKIWLSNLFFDLTGAKKEFLSEFPVTEISNDVIKLNLFEDIFLSKENRELQKAFFDKINVTSIEKRLYPY